MNGMRAAYGGPPLASTKGFECARKIVTLSRVRQS